MVLSSLGLWSKTIGSKIIHQSQRSIGLIMNPTINNRSIEFFRLKSYLVFRSCIYTHELGYK